MTSRDIDTSKANLRKKLKAIRANAFENQPNHGTDLVRNFPFLDKIIKDKAPLAGFYPFGDEVDILPLLEMLEKKGVPICLPRINASSDEIGFHKFHFGDALEISNFGIKEPREYAELITPNWVLVPLLGFDKFGNRIGYGKGYYDRAIKNLRKSAKSTFVGVAFSAQEVEKVPTTETDERLDFIICPEGLKNAKSS